MLVRETMTQKVHVANPEQPIREAAEMMARLECGSLPVGENDRLIGMITDRDIAVRAVADGKSPDTPIRDVMSKDLCYCFDDQKLDDVCANMANQKIRRLPVVSRDKRLVGIVSLGDIARMDSQERETAAALSCISEPGGEHSQAMA